MLGLLQRVPSVPVMALVTSVLVQKETGGNLAEILGQISTVVRGRFRLERKIRDVVGRRPLVGMDPGARADRAVRRHLDHDAGLPADAHRGSARPEAHHGRAASWA